MSADLDGAEARAAANTAAGVATIEQALAQIRRVSKPKDDLGPFAILLWAAQSHIIALLESVFYLGFRGKTGAGKGTSLEAACNLAPNGVILSITTDAFLATVLDEGRAVCIPEADKLVDRNELIGKVLRDGYRRGAVAGFKVPTGKGNGWETAERSLFGPKAFDFHVSIDTHLLGRTVVIEMEPDDSVDRALDAEKKVKHLAPVKAWLASESKRVLSEWTPAKVDALLESPDFRAQVKGLGGRVGRDHVVGANLLLLCRLFGWAEFESEIPRLIASRRAVEDWSDEAEVLEVIRELAGTDVSLATSLTTVEVHEAVNSKRAQLRLRPLSRKGLGRVLVDLGFRKGKDYVRATKGRFRDQWSIQPFWVLTQLTHLTQTAPGGPSPLIETPEGDPTASDAPHAPHTTQTGGVGLALASGCCSQGRDLIRVGKTTFVHADDRKTCFHPKSGDAPSIPFGEWVGTIPPTIDTTAPRPRRSEN